MNKHQLFTMGLEVKRMLEEDIRIDLFGFSLVGYISVPYQDRIKANFMLPRSRKKYSIAAGTEEMPKWLIVFGALHAPHNITRSYAYDNTHPERIHDVECRQLDALGKNVYSLLVDNGVDILEIHLSITAKPESFSNLKARFGIPYAEVNTIIVKTPRYMVKCSQL